MIAAAKVPIIKFDDTLTGLAFDVSFDGANGPKTAILVANLMHRLPPMRQLVIILKLFLQQRDMNEVSRRALLKTVDTNSHNSCYSDAHVF